MGRSKPTATRLAAPEPAHGPEPGLSALAPDSGGGSGGDDSSDLACQICIRTDGADTMVLCDACSDGYHTHCMRPPRRSVPRGAWLCPTCVLLAVTRGIKLRDMVALVDKRHCYTCRKPTGRGARGCVECRLFFHASCLPRSQASSASRKASEFRCPFCAAENVQEQTSFAPDVVGETAGAANEAYTQPDFKTGTVSDVRALREQGSPSETADETDSSEGHRAPSVTNAKLKRAPRKTGTNTITVRSPRRAAQKTGATRLVRKPVKRKRPSETAVVSKDANGETMHGVGKNIDMHLSAGKRNSIPHHVNGEQSKPSDHSDRRLSPTKDAEGANANEKQVASQETSSAKLVRKPVKTISRTQNAVRTKVKKPSETAVVAEDANGAASVDGVSKNIEMHSSAGKHNGIPHPVNGEQSKPSEHSDRRLSPTKDAEGANANEKQVASQKMSSAELTRKPVKTVSRTQNDERSKTKKPSETAVVAEDANGAASVDGVAKNIMMHWSAGKQNSSSLPANGEQSMPSDHSDRRLSPTTDAEGATVNEKQVPSQKTSSAKLVRKPVKAISRTQNAVRTKMKKSSETAVVAEDANGAASVDGIAKNIEMHSSAGERNSIPHAANGEQPKPSDHSDRSLLSPTKDAEGAKFNEKRVASQLKKLDNASLGEGAELGCGDAPSTKRPVTSSVIAVQSAGFLSSSFLSSSTSPAAQSANVKTGQVSETCAGSGPAVPKDGATGAVTTEVLATLDAPQIFNDLSKRPRWPEYEEGSQNSQVDIRLKPSPALKRRKAGASELESSSSSRSAGGKSRKTRSDASQTLFEATNIPAGQNSDSDAPLRNVQQTSPTKTAQDRGTAPLSGSKCSGSSEHVASSAGVPSVGGREPTSTQRSMFQEAPAFVEPPASASAEQGTKPQVLPNGGDNKVLELELSNDVSTRFRPNSDILPAKCALPGERKCEVGLPVLVPPHDGGKKSLDGSERADDKQKLTSQTQEKLNGNKRSVPKRPRSEMESHGALFEESDSVDGNLPLADYRASGRSPGGTNVATVVEYGDARNSAKAFSSSASSSRTVKDPVPFGPELPAGILNVSRDAKDSQAPLHNVVASEAGEAKHTQGPPKAVAAPETCDVVCNVEKRPRTESPLASSAAAGEEARVPSSVGGVDSSSTEPHKSDALPVLKSVTPDRGLSGEEAAMVMAAALQAGSSFPRPSAVPIVGASQGACMQDLHAGPPIRGTSVVPEPVGIASISGPVPRLSTAPLNSAGLMSLPTRTILGRGGGSRRQGRQQVPSHADDPLFVPPGQVRNWHILNVCVGKPFHSGLFVDLPYASFFNDTLRVIFSGGGLLRAVAFAKRRCSRTDALREWWLSNRQHFPSTSLNRETMPAEVNLAPTPCD